MTVSTLTRSVTYIGNGSATSFAVPFKVLDSNHLRVRRLIAATGAVDHIYTGTEFSYSGIGNDAGTLTLVGPALSNLYKLLIERVVPYKQELDLVNVGGFYPDTVEDQLDLMTMGIQQIGAQSDDLTSRALLVPIGQTAPSYSEFAATFKGDKGVPGSGNLVGFSVDDYCIVNTAAGNTVGLAALAAAVQAAGGGVVDFTPGKTYLVGVQTFGAITGPHPWAGFPAPLFVVTGLTAPLIIRGNGAKIRCASGLKFGAFDTSGTAYFPSLPYEGSNIASPYKAMLDISNCSGLVHIENIELDGNINSAVIGGDYGDTGKQIPMRGLSLTNNSGGGRVLGVNSHHHGLDGVQFDGVATAEAGYKENWRFEACRFDKNCRLGLAFVGGTGVAFHSCTFDWNGANDAPGGGLPFRSNPASGIDLEAEGGKVIRDISWYDCDLVGNFSTQVVADATNVKDIDFYECRFVQTHANGYCLWPNVPNFRVWHSKIVGTNVNLYGDVNSPETAFYAYKCLLTNDPAYSPTGVVGTVNQLLVESASNGAMVEHCTLIHKGIDGSQVGSSVFIMKDSTYICTAGQGGIFALTGFRGRNTFIKNGGTIYVSPGAVVPFTSDGGPTSSSFRWIDVPNVTSVEYPATLDARTGKALIPFSIAYNPPSLAAAAKDTIQSATVTGAALGDAIKELAFSLDLAGARIVAWVSAADTIKYYAVNENGANPLDLAAGTLTGVVVKA